MMSLNVGNLQSSNYIKVIKLILNALPNLSGVVHSLKHHLEEIQFHYGQTLISILKLKNALTCQNVQILINFIYSIHTLLLCNPKIASIYIHISETIKEI